MSGSRRMGLPDFDPVGGASSLPAAIVCRWERTGQEGGRRDRRTEGVHGVALAQGLNRGFTSNGRANTVSVFGLDDLKITKTIDVGVNPTQSSTSRRSSASMLQRTRSQRQRDRRGRPRRSGDRAARWQARGRRRRRGGACVRQHRDTAELVVIDQASNRIQARWPLKPCVEPTGLAIDVAQRRLFSVCGNNKMVIVDADSGRLLADPPIGDEPMVLSSIQRRQGIQCQGQGTVTVVQEATPGTSMWWRPSPRSPARGRLRWILRLTVSISSLLVWADSGAIRRR